MWARTTVFSPDGTVIYREDHPAFGLKSFSVTLDMQKTLLKTIENGYPSIKLEAPSSYRVTVEAYFG